MTDEKVDYIKRHINMIPVQERREVIRALVQRGKMHRLRPTVAGIAFDPAQLTDEDIDAVHKMLEFQLNKQT